MPVDDARRVSTPRNQPPLQPIIPEYQAADGADRLHRINDNLKLNVPAARGLPVL